MENSEFVRKLQQEAALQARLNRERILPRQLDPITSFIGNYTWQVLLVLSFVTAVLLEVFELTGGRI